MNAAAEVDRDGAARTAAAFHAAYRVLASLFLPPEPDRVATIIAALPELRTILWPLSNLRCGGILDRIFMWLDGLDDDEVEQLGSDHAALFLSGSRDRAVQPYESWHVGAGDYEQPSVSASLSARYREAGLAVGIPGELPDHVAIELEFCAYLCHEEGDADPAAVVRWREERRRFLLEHPLRWLRTFERALRGSVPATPYTEFARAARAVADDDRMLLDALLAG